MKQRSGNLTDRANTLICYSLLWRIFTSPGKTSNHLNCPWVNKNSCLVLGSSAYWLQEKWELRAFSCLGPSLNVMNLLPWTRVCLPVDLRLSSSAPWPSFWWKNSSTHTVVPPVFVAWVTQESLSSLWCFLTRLSFAQRQDAGWDGPLIWSTLTILVFLSVCQRSYCTINLSAVRELNLNDIWKYTGQKI